MKESLIKWYNDGGIIEDEKIKEVGLSYKELMKVNENLSKQLGELEDFDRKEYETLVFIINFLNSKNIIDEYAFKMLFYLKDEKSTWSHKEEGGYLDFDLWYDKVRLRKNISKSLVERSKVLKKDKFFNRIKNSLKIILKAIIDPKNCSYYKLENERYYGEK